MSDLSETHSDYHVVAKCRTLLSLEGRSLAFDLMTAKGKRLTIEFSGSTVRALFEQMSERAQAHPEILRWKDKASN